MFRCVLALGLAVVSVLGACGGPDTTGPTPADPATIQAPATSLPVVDEVFGDPGEPVSVVTGTTFALSLDANPSTGNAWSLTTEADPAVAVGLGHQYGADPDAEGATGVGGTDLWAFAATGPGDTAVTLSYGAPGQAPLSEATFRIVVGR